MVDVWKLTKRHVDTSKHEYKDIVTFHSAKGIGSIDFNEKIASFSEQSWEEMLKDCGEYAKFKLGNLSKYFEIEILPEHARELIMCLKECSFKDILKELDIANEGYIVLKKSM